MRHRPWVTPVQSHAERFLDKVEQENAPPEPEKTSLLGEMFIKDGPLSVPALLGTLGSLLESGESAKMRRTGRMVTIASFAFRTGRAFHHYRNRPLPTFRVVVGEEDPAYDNLMQWVIERMDADEQHELRVLTIPPSYDDLGLPAKRQRTITVLEGSFRVETEIDGFPVTVASVNGGGNQATVQRGSAVVLVRNRLHFVTASPEAREAVVQFIERQTCEQNTPKPRLFVLNRWGEWQSSEAPQRDLSTVILREGLKDDLVLDASRFLASERVYGRLGLPWHRGWIFEGPPGTGKSSLARAVATHLGLDIYFAALGDLESDSDLLRSVGLIRPRSILLLEDIDVLGAKVRREEGKNGPKDTSLSAMLNALDGITTPQGIITIMTTNAVESIDPAFLRPGRIDRTFHIGHLDQWQAEHLAGLVMGQARVKLPPLARDDLSPAEFLEEAKRGLHAGSKSELLKRVRAASQLG